MISVIMEVRMKRIQILACVGLCCFLTACAENANEERETDGYVQITGEQGADEKEDEPDTSKGAEISDQSGGLEESGVSEEAELPDEPAVSESSEKTNVPEPVDEEELLFEMTEPTEILLENPSQEYYLTEPIASGRDTSLTLELLTEEANQITDTEKWFQENELTPVDSFHMEDDTYRYEIVGNDYASGYLLSIYRKEDGMFLKCLDFSNYRYADNIKPGDEEFVEQRVWWAQSAGDVLYAAISHNTYTESCPHTGYLVAIDLNDDHVIWKSAPCMTNGRTFEIIDDTIVCGYGFTSEPDYLNLVSCLDGSLLEQIPVKTAAEYIIRKDDVLYVRTYDTNYAFQLWRAIGCP
mgnify:CR=1 FL=1